MRSSSGSPRAATFSTNRVGFAQHHPTGRGHRLHSLRQSNLLANRGVTGCTRTDFTGDHLARVESRPHLQRNTVVALDLAGQVLNLALDVQRRQTGTQRMVLERGRRPEHGHDPVAGEFVDGAAVPLDGHRRAIEHLRHDFA